MTPGDQKVLNQWARSNSWATLGNPLKNHKFWKKTHPLHGFCHIPVFSRKIYTVSKARDTQSCWTVHWPSTPPHTWHLKMQFSLTQRGTAPRQPSAPWQCGSPADKAGCCWLKMPLSGATQFVDLRFPYLTILKPLERMTIKPEHSYQQNTGHHGAQVITGSGETLVAWKCESVLCIVCKRRMSEGKNGTMPSL